MESQILLNVEEKMQYNCIIFTKKAYKDYLEINLNNQEFLKDISDISPKLKLSELEEIESMFSIKLEKGKDYLLKVIEEQSNKDSLKEYEGEISLLYQSFRSDRNGENFDKIRRELEKIEDNVLEIKNENLSDELLSITTRIQNTIHNFKNELSTILDTFMTDEKFEDTMNKLFTQNRIWQNKYGNYNFNPYIDKTKGQDEVNIEYVPLVKCSFLPKVKYEPTFNRYFAPLVMGEYLYISLDARSISCLNSKKEEEYRIELNDDIMASGAIMFLKGDYYLLIPCKDKLKVINDDEIIYELDYKFNLGDNFQVKSITVFNNMAYINIANYDNNTSIVFILSFDFYRKQFVSKPAIIFKSRIMSNIYVIHDYDTDNYYASYILENQMLVIADMNSLDQTKAFKVDIMPIDREYKREFNGLTIPYKYYHPIAVYEDKIYYTGYTKSNELCLAIVNPFKEEESKIILPRYQKQSLGDMIPAFTNIAVSLEKAYVSGYFDGKVCEISLGSKSLSYKEKDVSKPSYNDFLIAYNDGAFVIDEGFVKEKKYTKCILSSVWLGHLIIRDISKDGYQLYIEA